MNTLHVQYNEYSTCTISASLPPETSSSSDSDSDVLSVNRGGDDPISFSYSSDEDLIPDLMRVNSNLPIIDRKPAPEPAPSRNTKRDSALSREQKRRRLSSMNVNATAKPSVAASPLTIDDHKAGERQLELETTRHLPGMSAKVKREYGLWSSEEADSQPKATTLSGSDHHQSRSRNGYLDSSSSSSVSSDSEDWEPTRTKQLRKTAKLRKGLKKGKVAKKKREAVSQRLIDSDSSDEEQTPKKQRSPVDLQPKKPLDLKKQRSPVDLHPNKLLGLKKQHSPVDFQHEELFGSMSESESSEDEEVKGHPPEAGKVTWSDTSEDEDQPTAEKAVESSESDSDNPPYRSMTGGSKVIHRKQRLLSSDIRCQEESSPPKTIKSSQEESSPPKTIKSSPHSTDSHKLTTKGPAKPVDAASPQKKPVLGGDGRKRPLDGPQDPQAKKLRLVDIDFTGGKFRNQPPVKTSLIKKMKSQAQTKGPSYPIKSRPLGDEKCDRPRVVSSNASNVLRVSHTGPKLNNPSITLASRHHHKPPFLSKTTPTDIFAQKDAILAAKFPQKRKVFTEHNTSVVVSSKHSKSSAALRTPGHKSLVHPDI